MAQPYVGEIRMFAGNFAPAGWMFCEGQLLPISEYETLFNLIGTTYGGDGQSTFALPDLRGRFPLHFGQRLHPGRDRRRRGGHADRVSQIPAHSHPLLGHEPAPAPTAIPQNNVLAQDAATELHRISTDNPTTTMSPESDLVDRRQPAAHQLPAVSLRRLHHFAVRDLPVPDLGGEPWIHSSPKSGSSRSTSPPRVGHSAMARSCRFRQNTALFSLLGTTYGGDGKSQLRASRPAGKRPDASRPGTGPLAPRPRRDRRLRDGDRCSSRRFPPTRTRACVR